LLSGFGACRRDADSSNDANLDANPTRVGDSLRLAVALSYLGHVASISEHNMRKTAAQVAVPTIFTSDVARIVSMALFVTSLAMLPDIFFPVADTASYLVLLAFAFFFVLPLFFVANYVLYRRYGARIYLWRWYATMPIFLVTLALALKVEPAHSYNYLPLAVATASSVWSGTWFGCGRGRARE
jgi:hypothetical protein